MPQMPKVRTGVEMGTGELIGQVSSKVCSLLGRFVVPKTPNISRHRNRFSVGFTMLFNAFDDIQCKLHTPFDSIPTASGRQLQLALRKHH